MTRKSRIDTEKAANGSGGNSAIRASEIKPESKGKNKKPAAKKKATRGSKQVSHKSAPSTMPTYEPTDEEIRIRAYFISERRKQLSLAGDSDNDWLEARRQLVEETNRSADRN